MRSNEIFEALTDIDDKFIAAAHPNESGYNSAVFRPEPRKPLWKKLVPVAACVAVITAVGVFGARYLLTRFGVETSDSDVVSSGGLTSNVTTGYPAEAPPLQQIPITDADVRNYFTMEEFPGYEFGAFNTGIILNGAEMNDVDVTLINGKVLNLFLDDLNGDGARELCASVIKDGKRCVDILDFANSDYYTTSIMSNKMYRLDINDNDELEMFETILGNTVMYKSLSLENAKLAQLLSDTRPMEIGNIERFGLPEFPELYFIRHGETLLMGNNTANTLIKCVLGSEKFFLADLNGDGKREIFAWSGMNTGDFSDYDLRKYITVYDIENGETYFNYFDNVKVEFVDDGIMLAKYDAQTGKEDSFTLSFDVLTKLKKLGYEEVPLIVDQSFTLPEYEGFTFNVDASSHDKPSFDFSWEYYGVANCNIYGVFLCDFDGDGRREIAMNVPYIGHGCIYVYGFMDNGKIGRAEYYENDGGCQLVEWDGELAYQTDNGLAKFEFKKSDLKPEFKGNYSSVVVGWDHTMVYTQILPWSDKYVYSIADRTLKITQGNEVLFDPGTELDELYYIADKINECLLFVFSQSDGKVGMVRITENDVQSIYIDDGFSINPTADALVLTDKSGNEEPIIFSYKFSD